MAKISITVRFEGALDCRECPNPLRQFLNTDALEGSGIKQWNMELRAIESSGGDLRWINDESKDGGAATAYKIVLIVSSNHQLYVLEQAADKIGEFMARKLKRSLKQVGSRVVDFEYEIISNGHRWIE